ncbi:hypothetical protein [Rosenbergiella epipactidis]|uniref:hypothetical protein n=1 Tax=Rosenbergiella epipactidis TaxID=1544694 RepID=UPI001F4D8185|nr:hypothetical protein [Rosenbergiella epipactidis]
MNDILNPCQQNLIISLCNDGDVPLQLLAEKAILGKLTSNEAEVLCSLISNEFMLNGITESFEPNDYGKELEELLDAVNQNS